MRGPSCRSRGPTGGPPHAARRCAAPDRPNRHRRPNATSRTSPGASFMPISLVSSGRSAGRSNAARSGGACRPCRRAARRRHGARRRRRYCATRRSAVSITSSSSAARAAAMRPSPPLSGRNSWRLKMQRKAHLGTSMLPNLMPPAACHSPAPGQPSPAGEPPPPGRAWNRCQMNGLPVRGSMPCDGDAEAPAPARHRPLGACRRQRPDDRLDDLLAAVVGAQRHRRARSRPDDGALLRDRP